MQRKLVQNTLVVLTIFLIGTVPGWAQAQGPTAVVTGSVVNVRAGPGTNYPVIGQVTKGTSLTVTARNQDASWWQVCCVGSRQGWIAGNLVTVQGSAAAVPISTPAAPAPAPVPAPASGWSGSYYANRDLQGTPALVRTDPAIDFRWNGASPGASIPGTDFSARWARNTNFDAGDYQFTAQVDDGVRLYLDNWRIIDSWRDGSARYETGTFRGVGAGAHLITVEYYQAAGDAMIVVWWDKAGQYPDWRGEYFNDIYFQGPPLLVRNDANIDFNWGIGSPDPRVPADNFSVRWTRTYDFEGGDYVFNARTSDGVRIYLDGLLVLNEWHDMPEGEYKIYNSRFYDLSEGNHTVVVEYYERGGIAFAQVWWNKYSGGGVPEE